MSFWQRRHILHFRGVSEWYLRCLNKTKPKFAWPSRAIFVGWREYSPASTQLAPMCQNHVTISTNEVEAHWAQPRHPGRSHQSAGENSCTRKGRRLADRRPLLRDPFPLPTPRLWGLHLIPGHPVFRQTSTCYCCNNPVLKVKNIMESVASHEMQRFSGVNAISTRDLLWKWPQINPCVPPTWWWTCDLFQWLTSWIPLI